MKRLLLTLVLSLGVPLALAANTATLTWGAVTTNTDGSAISGTVTYNVYQTPCGSTSGGTQLANGITALIYTVSAGLTDGTTVCFNVTAVAGGIESAYSAQGSKTFPAGVPNPPASLTVK